MSSDQHYGWLGHVGWFYYPSPFTKEYNAYAMSLVGFGHCSYWSYTGTRFRQAIPQGDALRRGGGVSDVQRGWLQDKSPSAWKKLVKIPENMGT